MNTAIELFHKAQNEQLTTIASHRVALLKSQDELKKFRGEDDYQIAVSTIVKEYPEGIVLTKLREVLPDSLILEEAVKKLVEKKEITTEPYGKRSQWLKRVPEAPVQPPQKEVVSVDTNPAGDAKWESVPPPPANQPTKPVTPAEDIAQE